MNIRAAAFWRFRLNLRTAGAIVERARSGENGGTDRRNRSKTRWNETFSGKRRSSVERAFELGATIDVVPLERLPVAPKSAESIDRGKRYSVALDSYRTGGLGRRFDRALSNAEEKFAKFVVSQFLSESEASTKASYLEGGWKAVPDRVIRSFCDRRGLKLPKSSEFGFAISTASLLDRIESGEGGPGSRFPCQVPRSFRGGALRCRAYAIGFRMHCNAITAGLNPRLSGFNSK